MSKSQRLFTEVREAQQDDYGEELYNQWVHHLDAQPNQKSNQAMDILNEVFESFSDTCGYKKK
tara:strand:+ start:590 stop:778 length:189 start_codon:yes stop_codon:yes gene_type:complete